MRKGKYISFLGSYQVARLCLRHEFAISINDNKAAARRRAFGINRGVAVAGGAFGACDGVFYMALNFGGAELYFSITFRTHKAVCHGIVHVFHRFVADEGVYVLVFCRFTSESVPYLIGEGVYVSVAVVGATMRAGDAVHSIVFNVLNGK